MNVNLMQRMTDALSRMLNDPSTRLAMRTLSERDRQQRSSSEGHNEPQPSTSSSTEQTTSSSSVPDTNTDSGWGSRPPGEQPRWRDPEQSPEAGIQANNIGNTIGELQDSITSMREEFLDRYESKELIEVDIIYLENSFFKSLIIK